MNNIKVKILYWMQVSITLNTLICLHSDSTSVQIHWRLRPLTNFQPVKWCNFPKDGYPNTCEILTVKEKGQAVLGDSDMSCCLTLYVIIVDQYTLWANFFKIRSFTSLCYFATTLHYLMFCIMSRYFYNKISLRVVYQ